MYTSYIDFFCPGSRGLVLSCFSSWLFPKAVWEFSSLCYRKKHAWDWFEHLSYLICIMETLFFSMLLSPASKSLKRLWMPVQDLCSIFLAVQVLVDFEMSSWVALFKTISSTVSVSLYSSCSSTRNLVIYTTHCVFPVLHDVGICFLQRISRHIIMVNFLSGV